MDLDTIFLNDATDTGQFLKYTNTSYNSRTKQTTQPKMCRSPKQKPKMCTRPKKTFLQRQMTKRPLKKFQHC